MMRAFAVAGLVSLAGLAVAAPPLGIMTYQGRLTNAGAAANGSFNLNFRLFTASVAGTEICSISRPGTTVSNGVFTVDLGAGVIDAAGGPIYTNLADVLKDNETLYVQTEVNGTAVLPRTRLNSAPFAINADRANSLGDTTVIDESTWIVTGSTSELTIAGSNLQLQLGDSAADDVLLQGSLFMRPNSGSDADQTIYFFNNGSNTSEWIGWDDSDDRFEVSDATAFGSPIAVGTLSIGASESFSRFGSGTPTSSGMNNAGDVFVTDDIECASTILVQGNMMFHSQEGEQDGVIYFREDGSDTGENFRWDDSVDRFVFSDGIHIQGNVTVEDPDGFSDIQSSGGITIRIDTDNNESGPNAGVFALNANAAEIFGTPLMRMQSTNEANLELDSGVTTNAFDFAEAFRPVENQMDLEAGDVVALAIGGSNSEHVERSTRPGQAMLLGVVSTKPAFVCGMGISAVQNSDSELARLQEEMYYAGDQWGFNAVGSMLQSRVRQEWRPIAMPGRVPCKVDTSYGVIRAGDRLTSSPTPGHAMRQNGPGMSLGIAMEDASEPGKILVLVRPMWYGGSSEDFGNLAESRVEILNASHAPPLPSADSLRVKELEAETRDLKARLADLERLVSSHMQGDRVLTAR